MMNGKDRVALARLDERMKSVHGDITEMKDDIKTLSGTLFKQAETNAKVLVGLDVKLHSHLSNHRDASSWMRQMPAVVIAMIAMLKSFFFR